MLAVPCRLPRSPWRCPQAAARGADWSITPQSPEHVQKTLAGRRAGIDRLLCHLYSQMKKKPQRGGAEASIEGAGG